MVLCAHQRLTPNHIKKTQRQPAQQGKDKGRTPKDYACEPSRPWRFTLYGLQVRDNPAYSFRGKIDSCSAHFFFVLNRINEAKGASTAAAQASVHPRLIQMSLSTQISWTSRCHDKKGRLQSARMRAAMYVIDRYAYPLSLTSGFVLM